MCWTKNQSCQDFALARPNPEEKSARGLGSFRNQRRGLAIEKKFVLYIVRKKQLKRSTNRSFSVDH